MVYIFIIIRSTYSIQVFEKINENRTEISNDKMNVTIVNATLSTSIEVMKMENPMMNNQSKDDENSKSKMEEIKNDMKLNKNEKFE